MARLLLVDNDERITDLVRWFLERRGNEVSCASSYRAARDRLGEASYDLLLADLELGEESGREELRRLADEGRLPPTLVVSGYLDAEIARELERIPGVLGTLSKPFDLNDLERAIAGALPPSGSDGPVREVGGADVTRGKEPGHGAAHTIVPPRHPDRTPSPPLRPSALSPVASHPSPDPVLEPTVPASDSVEIGRPSADTEEDDGWIEIVPLGGGPDDGPREGDR